MASEEPKPAGPIDVDSKLFCAGTPGKGFESNDYTDLPEYITLRRSGLSVPKGQVFRRLRSRYAGILKHLAKDAMPDSLLSAQIEDISTVAALANRGRLLARHDGQWSKVLYNATRVAKQEMDKIENMLGQLEREDDIKIFEETVVARARARYSRAIKAINTIHKLIGDLKEHLGEQ